MSKLNGALSLALVVGAISGATAALDSFGVAGHFTYLNPYGRDQGLTKWPINTTEQLKLVAGACGGSCGTPTLSLWLPSRWGVSPNAQHSGRSAGNSTGGFFETAPF